MTLGKGIGAGVPLAALCAREAVSCFQPGAHGGTYNRNPLMTAAGVAVFDTLTAPGFRDSGRARSQHISAWLVSLSDKWSMMADRAVGLLRALQPEHNHGPATLPPDQPQRPKT